MSGKDSQPAVSGLADHRKENYVPMCRKVSQGLATQLTSKHVQVWTDNQTELHKKLKIRCNINPQFNRCLDFRFQLLYWFTFLIFSKKWKKKQVFCKFSSTSCTVFDAEPLQLFNMCFNTRKFWGLLCFEGIERIYQESQTFLQTRHQHSPLLT